jgi:hypothetical protein
MLATHLVTGEGKLVQSFERQFGNPYQDFMYSLTGDVIQCDGVLA